MPEMDGFGRPLDLPESLPERLHEETEILFGDLILAAQDSFPRLVYPWSFETSIMLVTTRKTVVGEYENGGM